MFSQNKRTCMDGSFQGVLIQFLSTAMAHEARATKVTLSFTNVLSYCTHWYSGHRIAQVRVVFKIPNNKIDDVFPMLDTRPPTLLAYVEWFSPIPATPNPKHLMYKVSRSIQGGRWRASIVPVDSIACSVHLLPRFGPILLVMALQGHGSEFWWSGFTPRRSQCDQLLVDIQALNVDYALSFKGHKGNGRCLKGAWSAVTMELIDC